jgi:acylpyruvate hydrolase
MKLITYIKNRVPHAGAVVGGFAIDLPRAAKALGAGAIPDSIRLMLAGGEPTMGRLSRTVRRAETKLTGKDRPRRRPAWALPLADVDLGPPIPDPEKIVCMGQNYLDHCREQGVEPPTSPMIFAKFPSCLIGTGDKILIPDPSISSMIDYEVELAVVFGRVTKKVKQARALDGVAGYMVFNDVTARDVQFGDKQWVRGKSFDTFAPCGPWLTTADEIADPHDLRLWLKLNGEIMQDSSTSNQIFKIPYLIEYLSRTITFKPGDILTTGTPPGVGVHRDPRVLMKPGDVVEAGVEGLGSIVNRCVRDRS